jgi:protein phosphatase
VAVSTEIDLGVWGVTDTGRVRTGNQDTFLALELTAGPGDSGARLAPPGGNGSQNDVVRLPLGPRGALLLVADGMGGAAGGDVASRLAADAVAESMARGSPTEPNGTLDEFAVRLRDAVVEAHARIQAYAAERPWLQGMGTTITVAGVFGGTIVVAQVGDSRAYLLRGEKLIQVTRDQTWAQEMVDTGVMTIAEARASPRRNVLAQALGATSNLIVPLSKHPLLPGDILLLCSDGLCGVVADARIERILLHSRSLREACESLVREANDAGGPDNITVLLAEPRARG